MSGVGSKRVIERPQRKRELQDALNHYLYHPLAWQLARLLAHTPITPNAVSVFGGMMVVAAGVVYYGLGSYGPVWPWGPLLGMALHMGWHVVDGADGDLARITGKTSPLGELVDGICDYVSHIVLYVLLAFVLTRALGPGWAWFWALAAGGSHIVQSNFVEVQRRFYQYWTYGVPWLNNTAKGDAEAFGGKGGLGAVLRVFVAGYLRLASGMSRNALIIDAEVTRVQDSDPDRLAQIRAEVAKEQRPLLFFLKFLGPNPRAIVLGFAMLAGSPLWYFLYQSVVLNVLLVIAVKLEDAAAARVVKRLGLG
ncbi:CDP-alcohol phosphatidyltransferase family protein [Novosphingobium cyanobacteriorum]|uniref:CDP-alcohol phosphatidyltransferase family protein n=1 Tax=Novosphingobium cyanobacteriorum TaxID=3024215 RepID=A0ABT6CI57_9SPHN|nr:CDP-alcohol phosphatidyltransferase family protein [Novosphingobium cyanobacteriorum]MDF8332973.1 CDP-alcohol phosphatidyltransferase family protein [Novosphingobium cyanobacteriorum]